MTLRFSVHAKYYKIAIEEEAEYWKHVRCLEEAPDKILNADAIESEVAEAELAYEKREKAAVVAITLAAMSIEAFLFDYAATKLGDSYVKEHLDKLDVKSKFLTFPKLICGTSPNKGGQAYEGLSILQKVRNDLVHFKSKSFDKMDAEAIANYHTELDEKVRKGVENSTRSVQLALCELDAVHGGDTYFAEELEDAIGS